MKMGSPVEVLSMFDSRLVLLTGATGYVGGRLLPRLVSTARVRCLARRPEALRARAPRGVEVVGGSVFDPESLAAALVGVDTAVYLIHSMGEGGDFADADRRAALAFGDAAKAAGVGKIVYLGALGDPQADLSPHLRSRLEVGDALRSSGVPVVELRAAVIIGADSLSFEMIRALVERLPIMVTPRWVDVATQPIAIDDVLDYLVAAVALDVHASRSYDIGGPDVVSYGGLMREYAKQRRLTRWMIPVPLLTPRISSLWLALITPLYARVGRALIDSIRHPTVVRSDVALQDFAVRPIGVSAAIERALAGEDAELAHTRWADATWLSAPLTASGGKPHGGRRVDRRVRATRAEPDAAFAAVERIGGSTGWYAAALLWRVRGWLDLLVGGVGMRRGRRHRDRLVVGDCVDLWRVQEIEPGRRLLLAAEMRLPGRGWLEFNVEPGPGGVGSRVRQTAIFEPLGLAGLAYWYALWPFHGMVFDGMLEGLVKSAEADGAEGPSRRGAGWTLDRVQLVRRPRDEVFAFFSDPANLERITPAFLRFRIVSGPVQMRAGALIDYRLRLYGIPLRWRTRIETNDPPRSFTDVQLSGPYRRWEHRHEFVEVEGGTEVRDQVRYEIAGGPLGALARRLFVRTALDAIFDYRQRAIAAIFPS